MELYINTEWTKCYGENYYIAESIVWSENGNHVYLQHGGHGRRGGCQTHGCVE